MRKLILSVAILASSLSVVAFANNISPIETVTTSTTEGFIEVSLEELPTTITDAVKKDYTDAVLTKAYVNSNAQYKLELKAEEVTNIVFIDKDGNWLKEIDIKA